MSAPAIVVEGWGVLCGTCAAPFAHPDAAVLCPHTPSVLPVIPPGAPLPTAIGPTYQAGPRTYRANPAPGRVRRTVSRALVAVGLLILLTGFAYGAWQAFNQSNPAPGCGKACAPAVVYTTQEQGDQSW